MKIYQLVTALSYGDAVGNHILALKSVIQELGYDTEILAESIDWRLENEGKKIGENFNVQKEDIIIYHLATATDLNYRLCKFSCKKILIYHNITPSYYFAPYDKQIEKNCIAGLNQIKMLADKIDYCLPESKFNKQDLIDMGYRCPIDVVPILIKFEDYKQEADPVILKQYADGITNIIFVGRIAPNKKHEDIILSFYYYKKYYDPTARLFLVGSYNGTEKYQNRLQDFCNELDLSDVYFTGHISFDKILAYYRIANIFLCMSEHEGFCVPLIEAMFFNIPIIAYDSSAIQETLDGCGILLHDKNHLEIAGIINKLVVDLDFAAAIIERERRRLKDFAPHSIKERFSVLLKKFIEQ